MNIQSIINQIALLFIIMAVGFAVGKTKMLTKEGNRVLSKFILFITLPCTILNSVFETEIKITAGDTMFFLLMALLAFAIAFMISLPVIRLLGADKATGGLLNFMTIFSNCGFMGYPVIIAIFGLSSAYYIALFNIPFNVLVFSVGIYMISEKKTKDPLDSPDDPYERKSPGRMILKQTLNPTLIVALAAIPIALTGLRFPVLINEAIGYISNITTPGAMIVLGASLAHVPFKSIFGDRRIAPVALLKLLVIPIVTWFILKQIITNELMLGVLVIISGMPTAAMSSMLAIEYGGNEKIASAGVFITTLLCGITVPLIVYLLLI